MKQLYFCRSCLKKKGGTHYQKRSEENPVCEKCGSPLELLKDAIRKRHKLNLRPEQCVDCTLYPCFAVDINQLQECTGNKKGGKRGNKTCDIDWGPDAPTFIDLFCGCGGASLGCIHAGYNLLCGIDTAKDALATYQYNLGNAIRADVKYLPLRPGIEPTLVVFCSPCQGFSVGNRMKKDKNGNLKPRYRALNRLILFAALAVEYLQPKYIFMENVPLIVKSPEFREMVKFFKFECVPPYDLQWTVLDAANFGVPQHRVRLILVGFKMKIEGIVSVPCYPYVMLPLERIVPVKDSSQALLSEYSDELLKPTEIWCDTGLFGAGFTIKKG